DWKHVLGRGPAVGTHFLPVVSLLVFLLVSPTFSPFFVFSSAQPRRRFRGDGFFDGERRRCGERGPAPGRRASRATTSGRRSRRRRFSARRRRGAHRFLSGATWQRKLLVRCNLAKFTDER
ncbi:hypothetical protein BRADI_4g25747v3, partial [Brachypodium distachyon]